MEWNPNLRKPKRRGGEGGGSSRIDSLVVTFKVAFSLDKEDDGDDDKDEVATFKVIVLQQNQLVRVHHLVVDVNRHALTETQHSGCDIIRAYIGTSLPRTMGRNSLKVMCWTWAALM